MLEFIENNAEWFILILLLAIVVEILVDLIPKRNKKNRIENQSQILDELSKDGNEIYVLFKKSDRTVVFVSENIDRILGLQPSHIRDDLNALGVLIEKNEQRKIEQNMEKMQQNGEKMECEIKVKPLNVPDSIDMKICLTPTRDEQYVILSMTDITKEQKIRNDLKEEIVRVQAIDESKTIFLSKMSHEIRTPMNGMLGMISLAKLSQAQNNSEEANGYLEKAEGLTQFLLSIINDILDMSRIESGKLELESAKFSLVDMAEKIKTMFQTTITEKGIEFKVDMQDFTTTTVMGDELRITQVITNFLSNASKFTAKGGHIALIFRQMELIDGHLSFMFRVKDDGIGMTPEFLHRIFIPFEQEDSGIARKYGGSGLGMAISDSLVKKMGGQILIDSEEGKGSEFTVFLELPIAEADIVQEKETSTDEICLEGKRMLMAEDNDVNALVTKKLLEHKGMIVERAVNGQEALEAVKEHEPGYYDAVLMDVHMPIMDGWEATKQIRLVDREDAKTLPIIALSADAFVEDKRHSVEVGMNGHVAKPIDYNELEKTLKECLQRNR